MAEQLQAFLELQETDLEIASLTRSLASLDSGDVLRKQLAEATRLQDIAKASFHKAEAEVRDGELALKSLEEKKKGFESRLYDGKTTNPKELAGIEKEIEMLGHQRGKLDERLIALYDALEGRSSDLDKITQVVDTIVPRLESVSAGYETKSKAQKARLDELNTLRAAIVARIKDAAMLQRYETLRARYKDTGLALVVDGKCGACRVVLTSFNVRHLKETGYETCESCARILVASPEKPADQPEEHPE